MNAEMLKLVFGILGNIVGVGVNLAPMVTFWNIYKKKDTQGFSGLPYVFSLYAAMIWVLYGLPTVTKSAVLVITINAAGSLIQSFYVTIFLIYADKKPKRHLIYVITACFAAFLLLVVLTLAVVPQAHRSLTVGSICVVIGVVTYASPLSVALMVYQTKSAEFLPIVLCICLFINSTIWSCYGIITKDKFILIPNGLGVFFGIAQLALYAIYRDVEPLDLLKGKFGDDSKGKFGDDSKEVGAKGDGKSIDKLGDILKHNLGNMLSEMALKSPINTSTGVNSHRKFVNKLDEKHANGNGHAYVGNGHAYVSSSPRRIQDAFWAGHPQTPIDVSRHASYPQTPIDVSRHAAPSIAENV